MLKFFKRRQIKFLKKTTELRKKKKLLKTIIEARNKNKIRKIIEEMKENLEIEKDYMAKVTAELDQYYEDYIAKHYPDFYKYNTPEYEDTPVDEYYKFNDYIPRLVSKYSANIVFRNFFVKRNEYIAKHVTEGSIIGVKYNDKILDYTLKTENLDCEAKNKPLKLPFKRYIKLLFCLYFLSFMFFYDGFEEYTLLCVYEFHKWW